MEENRIIQVIQNYIDKNNIYKVIFGHYEGINWVPLRTEKVNLLEAFIGHNDGIDKEVPTSLR